MRAVWLSLLGRLSPIITISRAGIWRLIPARIRALPALRPRRRRRVLALIAGIAAMSLALPAGVAYGFSFAVGSAVKLKAVSYRGYRFEVPASWPVIELGAHPGYCVRFDVHAVYLGAPSANQHCPAWLLGATDSLLVQPGSSAARPVTTEDPVADEITASAPRISLTAMFGASAAIIDAILASAGLPAPRIAEPDPGPADTVSAASAGLAGQSAAETAGQAHRPKPVFGFAPLPQLPANVGNDVGLGFDVCAAPSTAVMSAWWTHSPYRAVGIYIGGADRSCDQVNLTPAWVRAEAAQGWRFMPMYAGPQAAYGQLTHPGLQAGEAARDAVFQAERLGFGPGTPLYYDMEAYQPSETLPALRFLSEWTKELHDLGYESGVYSSSDSAVADLSEVYHSRIWAIPDVIYDALWNGAANVQDAVYGRGDWPGTRLHQYSGNVLQTFGGDTLEIDQDYLNLNLIPPGGTLQAAPGAVGASGAAEVFYQGSDHHLWAESRTAAGRWSRTDLGGYLTATPTVVQVGTDNLDVLYRGLGGYLWLQTRSGSHWYPARELSMMGILGSAPRAVAQPNGVIDVFWRGSHDDHLWHGQYSPFEGWYGPQQLGGSLASSPYPVETSSGVVEVFWEGTDHSLWRVVRGVGQNWSGQEDLGMGPLGSAPHAVALPGGEIDIFWSGDTSPHHIWMAYTLPQGRVAGPFKVGGIISGQPWPVAAVDSEFILYRGPDGQLWDLPRKPDGRWAGSVRVTTLGMIPSQPFATAGQSSDPVDVFWLGYGGMLWTGGKVSRYGRWMGPEDLGGRAG
jgi:hypothetical protein